MNTFRRITDNIFWGKEVTLCRAIFAVGAIQCKIGFLTSFSNLHDADPFSGLHEVVRMAEDGDSLRHLKLDPNCQEEYQAAIKEMAAHELVPENLSDEEWEHLRVCADAGISENEKQEKWNLTVEKLSDPNLSDVQKRKLLNELHNVIEGNTQPENHYKRVSITDKFPHAKYLFDFNGIPLVKVGQECIITGQEGAGKTTLLNMIISAYIVGTWKHAIGKINDVGRVLSIDTELPEEELHDRMNVIYTMSGLSKLEDYPMIDFLTGIELSSKDRQRELEQLLDCKEYGLLIIDNYNDFFEDPNNSEEAGNVKDFFSRMISKYKLALIVVTHDNPTFDITTSKCSYASGTRAARFARAIVRVIFDPNSKIHTCTLAKNSYGKDKIEILKYNYDNQGYLQNVPLDVPSLPETTNNSNQANTDDDLREYWYRILGGSKKSHKQIMEIINIDRATRKETPYSRGYISQMLNDARRLKIIDKEKDNEGKELRTGKFFMLPVKMPEQTELEMPQDAPNVV